MSQDNKPHKSFFSGMSADNPTCNIPMRKRSFFSPLKDKSQSQASSQELEGTVMAQDSEAGFGSSIQAEPPTIPFPKTIQEAFQQEHQRKTKEFSGQALERKKQGLCPECGEKGEFLNFVLHCSKHGEY